MSEHPRKSAYDQLVEEIKNSHPEKITEIEAHQIARRLMGFCEKLIEVNSKIEKENNQNYVDLQRVDGNVNVK